MKELKKVENGTLKTSRCGSVRGRLLVKEMRCSFANDVCTRVVSRDSSARVETGETDMMDVVQRGREEGREGRDRVRKEEGW